MKRPTKGELLLEVGCEEIPAGLLNSAREQLQEVLERELEARGLLMGGKVRTFSTPRRLIATCATLAVREPDRETQAIGPPKSIAYDAQGRPTRAAESFAKRQGLKVGELKVIETPKGAYVAAVVKQRGQPADNVLKALLPGVITRLSFPRSMYWTSPGGLHFIRPIRWVLALFAGKVIPFQLEGLRSGDQTFGHRLLAPRPLRVRSFASYQQKLRRAFVRVDPDERRAQIVNECDRLLERHGLRRRADNELLELLVNQVEHPAVVLGEFSRDYLALPAEVSVTVMRHHQKYFSVEDRQGKLVPHFLAVIDLDGSGSGQIGRNHEAVLAARFGDAEFFWGADQRRTLAERLPLLEQATFVARAGSYRQKVERLARLAAWLGENVTCDGRRADIVALVRAAELCKSDLTTEMVGEFPELQGVIGGLYARAQGEAEPVARAIYEHYKPAGAEDSVPETHEGALLSLGDKLDTVAACFSVGLIPSGSRDPYALRRAAAGVVRIVVERRLRLSLLAAVEAAVSIVHGSGLVGGEEAGLATTILSFLEERTRHLFRETRGFAYDEVNAVFAAGWEDLVDTGARLGALREIRPTPDFEPLAAAFKRIRNILEQAGGSERFLDREINTDYIEAGAERELYDRFLKLRPRVAGLREKHRYAEAFREVASLRPQVDRFFDKVLVMAPEEARRENRLALLAQLLGEFSAMADFSEIVVTTKGKES